MASSVVAVGWLVTPGAVTVYDGVGQPDEPYRYVSTPPGARVAAKKPTGAKAVFSVVDGFNTHDGALDSTEVGPQVSVLLPAGGLAASAGTISVTVVPIAASGQPAVGRIDGNVYRLSITNPAGPVHVVTGGRPATIYLRATTQGQPGPVVEHRSGPGQKWRPLKTTRIGFDIYEGRISAAGEYSLVFLREPTDATVSSTGTGSSHRGLVIGLLVCLVLLLGVVLAVRKRAPNATR